MTKKIKVGIAEDNRDMSEILRDFLEIQHNIEIVFIAYNGLQAVDAVIRKQPDVLILDIMMPYLDGLGVLEEIKEIDSSKLPKTIILSSIGEESIIQKAISLGADYYMTKPLDLNLLTRRIYQISGFDQKEHRNKKSNAFKNTIDSEVSKNNDLENDITNVIRRAGIPAHIKGYHYLRHGMTMIAENKDLLSAITKELYPAIAKKNNSTPGRVERAIRYSIEVAWSRKELDALTGLFGYIVSNNKDRPTNSEFIALIADKLRLDRNVG